MATEQILKPCSKCGETAVKSIRLATQLHCLMIVALLALLLGGAVAAPAPQPVIQAWQNPCYTDGSISAGVTEPPAQVSQQNHEELLKRHIEIMAGHLSGAGEHVMQLKDNLIDRLPSSSWAENLHDETVTGMAISKLPLITPDLEWSEITRKTYELIARAYIYVDQMVTEERRQPQSLQQPLAELRRSLQDDVMCPMHVYHVSAHGTGPLDDSTRSMLLHVHENLSSTTEVRRNERNFMILRDLKKVTDRMTYDLYRPDTTS